MSDQNRYANQIIKRANFDITDATELAMLMAQIDHETAGFTRFIEPGWSYRRSYEVFPNKYKSMDEAYQVYKKYGQVGLYNRMYGGRLGNVDFEDGYKYRGAGPLHVTGKYNYIEAEKKTGVPYVSKPELMCDPVGAMDYVLYYWQSRGCDVPARQGDVIKVTKIINGGTNGLRDRTQRFSKWVGILAPYVSADNVIRLAGTK